MVITLWLPLVHIAALLLAAVPDDMLLVGQCYNQWNPRSLHPQF